MGGNKGHEKNENFFLKEIFEKNFAYYLDILIPKNILKVLSEMFNI